MLCNGKMAGSAVVGIKPSITLASVLYARQAHCPIITQVASPTYFPTMFERYRRRKTLQQQIHEFLLRFIEFEHGFRQSYPTDLHPDIDKALSSLHHAGHSLYYDFAWGESRSGRAKQVGVVVQEVHIVDTWMRIEYAELQSQWIGILGLWTLLLGELNKYCRQKGKETPWDNESFDTSFHANQSLNSGSDRKSFGFTGSLKSRCGSKSTPSKSNYTSELPMDKSTPADHDTSLGPPSYTEAISGMNDRKSDGL
jgi:hypothetical protein